MPKQAKKERLESTGIYSTYTAHLEHPAFQESVVGEMNNNGNLFGSPEA